MLNNMQLDHLLNPVIHRSMADFCYGKRRFIDRAARFVVERLCSERATSKAVTPVDFSLKNCAWIDEQLLSFFNLFPEGEGVEINGGLSTRFHRLSERLDWPRFHWRAINSLEVDDCIKYVFPEIDHYNSFACENPLNQWCKYIWWNHTIPRVIVHGENKPFDHWFDIELFIQNTLKATAGTQRLEIILTHRVPDFLSLCEQKFPQLEIIGEFYEPDVIDFWSSLGLFKKKVEACRSVRVTFRQHV